MSKQIYLGSNRKHQLSLPTSHSTVTRYIADREINLVLGERTCKGEYLAAILVTQHRFVPTLLGLLGSMVICRFFRSNAVVIFRYCSEVKREVELSSTNSGPVRFLSKGEVSVSLSDVAPDMLSENLIDAERIFRIDLDKLVKVDGRHFDQLQKFAFSYRYLEGAM